MNVVTHNGIFHADDVFAAAILRMAYGEDLEITRTRDPKVIEAADIAFDVGGENDPDRGRFDHHQRGGAGVRENGVPYAAAGLLWNDEISDIVMDTAPMSVSWTSWRDIMDRELIQGIDALDNGFALSDPKEGLEGIGRSCSLSAVISAFNPIGDASLADYDATFEHAVEFALGVLRRKEEEVTERLRHRSVLETALRASSGPILVLEEGVRWGSWIHELEEELGIEETQFVIFLNPAGTWMVQAVPPTPEAFAQRTPLPEEWAGKRDEELSNLLDLPECVFVHPGRFIGGHTTREGAVRMAEMALSH
jgi:uncharacterized UPF0160 family protein